MICLSSEEGNSGVSLLYLMQCTAVDNQDERDWWLQAVKLIDLDSSALMLQRVAPCNFE